MNAFTNGALSVLEKLIDDIDNEDPDKKSQTLQLLKKKYLIYEDMYRQMGSKDIVTENTKL